MAKQDFSDLRKADFLFIADDDGNVVRKVTLDEAKKMSAIERADVIAQQGKRQWRPFAYTDDDPGDIDISDGHVSF